MSNDTKMLWELTCSMIVSDSLQKISVKVADTLSIDKVSKRLLSNCHVSNFSGESVAPFSTFVKKVSADTIKVFR
jgi:hypothetical protein